MAFDDLTLQVSPLTKTINLGTPSADGTRFVGKKKDMTNEVIGAMIEKVGVGSQLEVSSPRGKQRWIITVTDPDKMDVSVIRRDQVSLSAVAEVKAPTKKTPSKVIHRGTNSKTAVKSAELPPLNVGPLLAKVVGKGPMPRSEIVFKLWEYIKKKDLQDKINKRQINCDAKMKAVFDKDRVSMFEMAALISKHVTKIPGVKYTTR